MNLTKKTVLTNDKKVKVAKSERSVTEQDNLRLVTRAIQQSAASIAERFSKSELEDICKHLDRMREHEAAIEDERRAMTNRIFTLLGQI